MTQRVSSSTHAKITAKENTHTQILTRTNLNTRVPASQTPQEAPVITCAHVPRISQVTLRLHAMPLQDGQRVRIGSSMGVRHTTRVLLMFWRRKVATCRPLWARLVATVVLVQSTPAAEAWWRTDRERRVAESRRESDHWAQVSARDVPNYLRLRGRITSFGCLMQEVYYSMMPTDGLGYGAERFM